MQNIWKKDSRIINSNGELKMEEKVKLRAVYSLRCAGYLMYNGVSLVSCRPLKENPRRNIFFFLDNEMTDEWINKYIANKAN